MQYPDATTKLAVKEGFARLVAQAGRQWRRAVDLRLQPFGLTEATWLPLVHLSRADAPMRQTDLARALSLDGSSVVRLLDALAAAGLAERRESPSDRRAKVIVLTDLGRRTVERVEAVSLQIRKETLHGLEEDELQVATQVLERVCRSLARITEPPA